MPVFRRFIAVVSAGIAALFMLAMLAAPAWAQNGSVSCGNGFRCPAGNACLQDGWCAVLVDSVPGSTRTSTGAWCSPGFRESTVRKGFCVPSDAVECANGLTCPADAQCTSDGGCEGGPPATGPVCGGATCMEGRICSSRNTCMDPRLLQDCGNGTICSRYAACEVPSGCVFVSPDKTRQFR